MIALLFLLDLELDIFLVLNDILGLNFETVLLNLTALFSRYAFKSSNGFFLHFKIDFKFDILKF